MGSSFPKPLTADEEAVYLKKASLGDKDARNILIERNLRLVAHIAKKFANTGQSKDDLISIGTIGLIKGIDTYSKSRATRLATYVSRCIENEILMCIRSTRKLKAEVSLNIPIGTDRDGNTISFDDILGTEPDDILDNLSLKQQISKLKETIQEVLDDREKEIICMRYGISGYDELTQREIAEILGISRSYVSRLEKKALTRLKSHLSSSAI